MRWDSVHIAVHVCNCMRISLVCLCMCVCMYVCMYVCEYVCCIYVCMYVCMYVCTYVCMHVSMHVCMHVCMRSCLPARLPACLPACLDGWMDVSTYTYMHTYDIHTYIKTYSVRRTAQMHMLTDACRYLQVQRPTAQFPVQTAAIRFAPRAIFAASGTETKQSLDDSGEKEMFQKVKDTLCRVPVKRI